MKKHQVLTLAGGICLLIGAMLPWATVTSDFLGLSRSITGVEGDGILSAIGGVILLLIGIIAKGSAGKTYSPFGIIVSILCGLLLVLKIANLAALPATQGVSYSLGAGLTLISPLGILLAVLGSASKVPAASEPVPTPGPTAPAA